MILAILALLAAHPHPSGADAPPFLSQGERETARVASEKGEGDRAAAVDAVAKRYNLAGEVLVAKGGKVLLDRGYGSVRPDGGAAHKAGERWRLASITKQVTAARVLQRSAQSGQSLDHLLLPVDVVKRATAAAPDMTADFSLGKLTARQLLTHHTGLANPDTTTTNAEGVPAFYIQNSSMDFCASKQAAPGAAFSYNNCDYLILGEAFGPLRWPAGMSMARPNEIGIPGFIGGKPEPKFQLASWGAAGGLMGTARAVFDFDRSLMTGKLLPPTALAELWKPEGNGSYQALGQWVFPGKLKGCASLKRIVQRDGEIYGVQARNFILPDDGVVVVFFTNRSADDFKIGEVWEGKGFAYDLLSAAAGC